MPFPGAHGDGSTDSPRRSVPARRFMYVAIFLFFACAGPGKYALSTALGWDEDNSLPGLLKQ